jgi:hypothetical protein
MLTSSYKYHLYLFRQKTKTGFGKKILRTLFGITLLIVGTLTALIYWLYKTEAPIRAEIQYLEVAGGGFTAAKQSVNEILQTFQIAGEKTIAVDSLKEASGSVVPTGYVILLEDLDKTIAKIESTEKAVKNKKLDLKKIDLPLKFELLNENLLSFYDQTAQTLQSSKKELAFAKEMLVAMGQNLYLPTLSDETLWTLKNEEALNSYYQNKKTELDTALTVLSRLSPPDVFKKYHEAQIAYLTRLAEVSDKIINTLSVQNDKNPENVQQIEIAYQILNSYKKENELAAQNLLIERLKAFDLKRNYEIFAGVNIQQNSLDQKFTDIYQNQNQINNLKTPRLIVELIFKSKSILRSLQVPRII